MTDDPASGTGAGAKRVRTTIDEAAGWVTLTFPDGTRSRAYEIGPLTAAVQRSLALRGLAVFMRDHSTGPEAAYTMVEGGRFSERAARPKAPKAADNAAVLTIVDGLAEQAIATFGQGARVMPQDRARIRAECEPRARAAWEAMSTDRKKQLRALPSYAQHLAHLEGRKQSVLDLLTAPPPAAPPPADDPTEQEAA